MYVCLGAPVHASSNTVQYGDRPGGLSYNSGLAEALFGGVGNCLRSVAQRNVGVLGRGGRAFPCDGVLAQTTRTDVLAMHGPHSFSVHTLTPGGANPVQHIF